MSTRPTRPYGRTQLPGAYPRKPYPTAPPQPLNLSSARRAHAAAKATNGNPSNITGQNRADDTLQHLVDELKSLGPLDEEDRVMLQRLSEIRAADSVRESYHREAAVLEHAMAEAPQRERYARLRDAAAAKLRAVQEQKEKDAREQREKQLREQRERDVQKAMERAQREQWEALRRAALQRDGEWRAAQLEEERAKIAREVQERLAQENRVRTICELYELKWDQLKTNQELSDTIHFEEFPFPVLAILHADPTDITYERVRDFIFCPLRDTIEGKTPKEIIRTELLRWHPDKFDTLIRHKMAKADWERTKDAAGLVTRYVTKLMSEV
ncbi:hypothetical protein C8Q79DRAFT_1010066 [Trametes meyenii]|nr:hypothetical protein C8Q79DRAFT_1010066 [Trametes meyenii]